MDVVTIETPSLGDRSYLVVTDGLAAVVDPQRDVDRVLAAAAEADATIVHVLETHVHNDYVSGGLELATVTGAAYHVNGEDEVDFDRRPIRDGDVVRLGAVTIRALATPGHTPTHLSYVVTAPDGDEVVFTGGSMLFGSVGRTDLVDDELTERLTRDQHRSVRRLADELDDGVAVLPTHGFGSFCSSGDTTGADRSTIGDERRRNQALTIDDEDAFVAELLAGLDAYPAYYAHMAPTNRRGPAPVDLSPVSRVDVDQLRARIAAGEWVVDLRTRTAFAADHLGGTVNVELADAASTYLGWILPWGTPVTLVGATEQDVAAMQRQLVRIGVDRPAGAHVWQGEVEGTTSYRVADFEELGRVIDDGGDPWVLDARRDLEWADGHLPGAHHVPLHELADRMDEVPDDREVWVHCASGYRASIAASLLARAGRSPVLIADAVDPAG